MQIVDVLAGAFPVPDWTVAFTTMGTSKEFGIDRGSNMGGTFTPAEASWEVASSIASCYYNDSIDPQASARVAMNPIIIIEGGSGSVFLLPGFIAVVVGATIGTLAMRYFASRREKQT